MKKKLKLPVMQMHREIFEVISPEELKSILGGNWEDWDSDQGFLNNVNYMIQSGMFNYNGSSAYDSGYVDFTGGASGGSGGSGLPGGSSAGFTGFNWGSYNPTSSNYFNFSIPGSGSSSSTSIFSFSAASGSGSGYKPGALQINGGNAGSFGASYNFNDGKRTLSWEYNGKTFQFEMNDEGKGRLGLGIEF